MVRFRYSGAVRRRPTTKTKTLQVPLSDDDWEHFVATAEREGMTPPELARAGFRELEFMPALQREEVARDSVS